MGQTIAQLKIAHMMLNMLKSEANAYSERGYHSLAEQRWAIIQAFEPFIPSEETILTTMIREE